MLCKPSCLDESYWERLVQSVKTALKATLGQCLASPDELRTVLCVVEARVNDRPLTFVGSDVQSDSASRGALSSSLRHLLRRWSYQRKLVDAFWKRWQRDSVVTLSSRGKWKRLQEQPRVDDVVLVADYNTARRHWPLGQMVELLIGSDGLSWSAKVKTAAGILCRSIRTLVLLEPAETHHEPVGLYLNAGYGGFLKNEEAMVELPRKCACDQSDCVIKSDSTDLSCFVSRSETNVARVAARMLCRLVHSNFRKFSNVSVSVKEKPSFIQVEDDSWRHSLSGTRKHIKVTIVSAHFEGLSLIERHRIVNNLCRSYFEENLHCLTMLTKTPSEWDGTVHSSVNCHRGRSVHGTPIAPFDKNNL
ncbi:BolA-like protein [Trichinella patagoniensis]|uniref:BolA-like protein n=1 Tax=Trichinella patagoniensis TaxID=990121 RepID=A0A0V0ZGX3_9BILA|nr:BolA-like protein [Trichinella patagoniensis]